MDDYGLRLAASAERTLARLPEFAAAAIVEFLTGPLAENPHRVGEPLSLELEGYLSARRGAYRIIYRVEAERFIHVVRIDHRADVYRPR
jgi:mRNA-degrading endonuclease RelE of RelBE toxin-antitoxin system